MKLLLHIGPPKTGTTSIQSYLRCNAKALERAGISGFVKAQWPRKLAILARNTPPRTPWATRQGIANPEGFARVKAEWNEALHRELSEAVSAGVALAVLSSEGLFSLSEDEIAALIAVLRAHCGEIEVLAYLRRQDLAICSRYKNFVRNMGWTGPVHEIFLPEFDYAAALLKWRSVVGADALRVAVFPDSAAERYDLLEDFESRIAERIVVPPGVTRDLPRRNTAWSREACAVMRILNQIGGPGFYQTDHWRSVVDILDKAVPGKSSDLLSCAAAEGLAAQYDNANEVLRAEFFALHDSVFNSNFTMYEEAPKAELSEKELARLVAQLSDVLG